MAAGARRPIDAFRETLEAHGARVRQSGANQWSAGCPNAAAHAHGDRSPSLSFGESPSGKVLVTCHKGCTVPDVAGALGLSMRDLFPKSAPTSSKERSTSTYNYCDEDGETLYRIVKRRDDDGSKTFRAQHLDAMGRWRDGLGGARKVLYNLPAVVAAIRDGRLVILCEGEKDAEQAAWAWKDGRAASTTNPFGAGKWDPSYSESLRGAHVVQIGDDDAAGRTHLDVCRIALSGIVASHEQWLPADGFNDLSEHLGAGRGIDELRPFGVDEDGTRDEHEERESIFVDWHRLYAQETSEREWIAEPLIPLGRSIALYAPAKTGKSLLLLDLAASVATGRSVLGGPPAIRRHVLYVDLEMTEDDLRERMLDLGYDDPDALTWLHYAIDPHLGPLDRADGGDALVALARDVDAALVVIDTLGRAVDGEENSADTLRSYYRHTASKLKREGRTVMRSDHAGKDLERGQRGTSAKNDDVDVVWQMTKADGRRLRVRLTHSRLSGLPSSITLEREDDPLRFVNVDGLALPEGTREIAALLDRLDVPRDASKRSAREALKEAEEKCSDVLLRAALRLRQEDDGSVSDLSQSAVARALGVTSGTRSTLRRSRSFPSSVPESLERSDVGVPPSVPHRSASPSSGTPDPPSKGGRPDRSGAAEDVDELDLDAFGDEFFGPKS